jgi:hypothetical protein
LPVSGTAVSFCHEVTKMTAAIAKRTIGMIHAATGARGAVLIQRGFAAHVPEYCA